MADEGDWPELLANATLTSRPGPAINVDVMENCSMALLLHTYGAALLIIAIARMLGKAVKLRHCPATVSALAPVLVVSASDEGRNSAKVILPRANDRREKPLEASCSDSFLGRWLKKAQVRRPILGP
jgi:hypothetical protein